MRIDNIPREIKSTDLSRVTFIKINNAFDILKIFKSKFDDLIEIFKKSNCYIEKNKRNAIIVLFGNWNLSNKRTREIEIFNNIKSYNLLTGNIISGNRNRLQYCPNGLRHIKDMYF